ncbi:MAG: hypothetical protein LBE82_09795 [Chitinophagaceae bacterium]|jgi:hypothetical protein|nr:hypothetical protein [Chitinophagaceae bacterium]
MALANKLGLTSKVVSERHFYASQTKCTAGEAANLLSKNGFKISAKELVNLYRSYYGYEPEWHHSGFYKSNFGKSTMSRTFFFSDEQISYIQTNWTAIHNAVANKQEEIEKENLLQKSLFIFGFYWVWQSDYGGRYGKKRWFKVLHAFEGSEFDMPTKNFTTCSEEEFEVVKTKSGKTKVNKQWTKYINQ